MNELLRTLLVLPEQASTFAREIDLLHYVVITISLLGALGVAAAVAILLLRYHHATGEPRHAYVKVPVVVELVAIAALLGMFLVFWIIGFRQFVHLQTPPANAIDVYVVGKQWMWQFAYADGTATQDTLYVPANRPVRLIMTSRDVIHSFYVPAFRIKQDVVPGRATIAWFEAVGPGEHDIYCTEYCGLEHSWMRGRVVVLDPAEWAKWAEGRRGRDDLATLGGRIAAERGCLRCHTVDGTPHLGPTWAGLYGQTIQMASGQRLIADEAYLTESMMDPTLQMRAGYLPIMPTYRGLIEGVDAAALVEYIKSLPAPDPQSPLPPASLPPGPVIEVPR
jgi:cytochrome c oxidase subunit 2